MSNGPYELQRAQGRGTRERLDDGVLGIATLTVSSASDMQKLISLQAAGRLDRFEGWREWTVDRFEVRSGGPVDVGVDGEALSRFRRSCRDPARRPHDPHLSPCARQVARRRRGARDGAIDDPRAAAGRRREAGGRMSGPAGGEYFDDVTPVQPPSERLAERLEAGPSAPDPTLVRALRELAAVDKAVYRAVAATPTPTLDGPLRTFTSAADHSKLWIGAAAVLFAVGGRGDAVRRSPAWPRSPARRRS